MANVTYYTAVFAGYDRLLPPSPHVCGDFFAFTDCVEDIPKPWKAIYVDSSRFPNGTIANRFYKFKGHEELPESGLYCYVDANIRVLRGIDELVRGFEQSAAPLMMFPHPQRSTLQAELEDCCRNKKLANAQTATEQLARYAKAGFADQVRLIEATIMVKNPRASALGAIMEAWWQEYLRYPTRDQLSLPFVLWKNNVAPHWFDFSFRDPNPYFGIYPHVGAQSMNPRYAICKGKAFDSMGYRVLLSVWDGWRGVRRKMRPSGMEGEKASTGSIR